MMAYSFWGTMLYLQSFFIICLCLHLAESVDVKVLNVGQELERETLPLKMGQRIYCVHGLKEFESYEVKISYPASVPASFYLQLMKDVPELWLNTNRRLLNTEKIIFKSDSHRLNSGRVQMCALVRVEAAGIVAKPIVQEREVVVFNIVCDELSLWMPHKAWWVGIAAIVCLILASVIPYLLPSYLLLRQTVAKAS